MRYGTKTVSFLGPKIRDILPNEIKIFEALHNFKAKKNLGFQWIALADFANDMWHK